MIIPKDWGLVAQVDEGDSYDVDITAIYQKPEGGLVLATASGCSCWDGDYDVENFDTLDAIAASIAVTGDERRYNPSPKGAAELLEQARKVKTW